VTRRSAVAAPLRPPRKADLQALWGVTPGWWLWAVPIRILIVIDGRINTGHERDSLFGFGLGPVLDTIREWFFLWVKIEVDVVKRDPAPQDESELGVLPDILHYDFRFTQEGFSLDDYDQLWLFGDWPGIDSDGWRDDTRIDKPENSPLSSEELRTIAEWMDRGGGVFATGDHGVLGATLSSKIPRVRAMRRWTWAQGALPEKVGPSRHETLVRAPVPVGEDGREYWEGDRWPQRIYPVYSAAPTNPLYASVFGVGSPHPLLCSRTGVIDLLPDHMHEGEVMPDDEVDLNAPLAIPGYAGVEFPAERPIVLAAGAPGGAVDLELFGFRPRPTVIAYGLTAQPETPVKRYGLIAAYDGDRVGVGRVVVDSTWHHWFSMNILGFADDNPEVYARLQAYYRNVALWLATPAQRAYMLFWATWGAITSSAPNTFDRTLTSWQVGERALDVIGRSAPQCFVDELVATVASAGLAGVPATAGEEYGRGSRLSSLPSEVVARAVVGSIGTALIDEAVALQEARATGGRHSIDPRALRDRAFRGLLGARQMLAEALERAAADGAAIREELHDLEDKLQIPEVPVLSHGAAIRIVIERIAVQDLPGRRSEERGSVALVRVRSGNVLLSEVSVPIDATADADTIIFEGTVSPGDELTLEVLDSRRGAAKMRQADSRFEDLLTGDPRDWIGSHAPGNGEWPMRYRVEQADLIERSVPGSAEES
jgi:hypothetical protein